MRKRCEIAGRAHRALRWNARHHVCIQHLHERVDDLESHARISACQRRDFLRDGQAHHRVVQQWSGACGVRQDERALQLGESRSVNARSGE